jgi:hypothetical protein
MVTEQMDYSQTCNPPPQGKAWMGVQYGPGQKGPIALIPRVNRKNLDYERSLPEARSPR